MWVPSKVIDWFTTLKESADSHAAISSEAIHDLREELSAVRQERDSLKIQLSISQNHFDWLRMQVNTLQIERTSLMEKAYGIKIPTPEIVRTPVMGSEARMEDFSFNDIGDAIAKQMGLPLYDKN